MYGYIYKTTNLVNSKIYIGQHKAKQFDDWYKGSGKYLWNAINKYGWGNFKTELLVECNSQDELDSEEIRLIAEYNSTDKSIGYNLTAGGGGTSGYKLSDETKRKISEANKGRKRPKEVCNKISNSLKGTPKSLESIEKMKQTYKNRGGHYDESKEKIRVSHLKENLSEETLYLMRVSKLGDNNPMYGREVSEETRNKRSKSLKGREFSKETRKKISDSNKGRIYINNGSHSKLIYPEDLDYYINKGYKKGRGKVTW